MNIATTFPELNKLLTTPPSKVGLFDSGIGGISILNELLALPVKAYVYIADTAHLPYGNKSPEFLIERACILTRYLEQEHGITTIVIACHTSAATTVSTLKKQFPHLTFIDPLPITTATALTTTKTGHIGIFATARTIESGMHKKLLLRQNTPPQYPLEITEQACPHFVDLIENGASNFQLETAVKEYTALMKTNCVDTLILGCTHYPFIASYIQAALPTTTLVSAASCIAHARHFLTNPKLSLPEVSFRTSGDTEKIEPLLKRYFNKKGASCYTIAQLETPYR